LSNCAYIREYFLIAVSLRWCRGIFCVQLTALCAIKSKFDAFLFGYQNAVCVSLVLATFTFDEEGEDIKCYTIWQTMAALLHSSGQLRTERDGDTEKGCKKNLLYSRRLLMISSEGHMAKLRQRHVTSPPGKRPLKWRDCD